MLLSLRGDSPGYAYTFPISVRSRSVNHQAGFLSFTIQSPITDVNLIYVDNVPVVVRSQRAQDAGHDNWVQSRSFRRVEAEG